MMNEWIKVCVTIFALSVAAGSSGCDRGDGSPSSTDHQAGDVVKREGNPDVIMVDDEDALMNRAIVRAKSTVGQFIAEVGDPQPSHMGHAVKYPFPTPDGGNEHIWIAVTEWDGESFHGVVNNEPYDDVGVSYGDAWSVAPEDISDWMFVDGDELNGGFTLRVLYHGGSAEDRALMDEQTGLHIPEIDF